ncbi:Chemotaxis protein methyltransferase CheR [Acidisarcina polymorpha]|uniref:Chemotaxis protein methyltransferase CheR n=1 Tax=Acidisarcina polymorpha TaxID=2211140 RepID=A0A2Z5G691_9BACT|nr:chemotaxis protein CheB [Acidisarcina polymorpha]AXC14621.1 Chemotaxis protein methyltransferase CheR [Acidisarcina polymorpha]
MSEADDEPGVRDQEADEVSGALIEADDHLPENEDMCPTVGIGASAGGLDAFTQMLEHLPSDTGMAYILVQHLDPSHESMLVELLASHTPMPVSQAAQGTRVEPNHVYIIPPNSRMAVRKGTLELTPRAEDRTQNMPIDFFLSSLAADQRSRAIGVILSGAASDGTLGLEAIKAVGGITFAQDESARFSSMPRSAVTAAVVDFVLPPDAIARELAGITDHSYFGLGKKVPSLDDGPALEEILAMLQTRSGVNFTHYKKPTIGRRLSRRMALNHIESPQAYVGLLGKNPAELDALFDDLLITVTEFFRDPETFSILAEKAFPAMLEKRKPDEPIRVWVSGCSTGKEVYSLAICLIEYLEKTNQSYPIQIFGTDVSEKSIQIARWGKYPESIAASISPSRLKKFFVKVEDGYQITRAVRELCVFSRQDITKDPPLAKMDLISCRNLLIYLGQVLQRRVLSIFIYALQPTGCLLLGNSESLGPLADYFLVIDAKHKIYRRNLALTRPQFEVPARGAAPQTSSEPGTFPRADDATILDRRADRMLLDEYAPSGFLIDELFHFVKFRGDVGPYLSPPPGDPELDVFRLVREDIAVSLRSAIEEARLSDTSARRDNIQIRRNDGFQEVNLIVRPLSDPLGPRHFLVLFEEQSHRHRSAVPFDAGRVPVEPEEQHQNLLRELSATRAYMQRLVEELRSANEEAQSSNEELQSTNEELQTAKEELQSSNEELTTTNEEMQSRNRELAQLNNDLVNLLSSMQMPIVMLDSDLRIRRFTPNAEQVLNLIPTDVGRPISDLKPRINVPDIGELLEHVIESLQPVEREVQHEDGRWYSMRIQPYKTADNRIEGAVLQLLDIHQLKLAMEEVKQARDYANAIIETVREPLLVLDEKLCVQTANHAFFEVFDTTAEETLKKSIYTLDHGQWGLPRVAQMFQSLLLDGNTLLQDVELEHEFMRIGWRTFQLNARYLYRSRETGFILLAIEDISDRKRAAEAKYRRLFEAAKDGIVIINADNGEITDVNPYLLELLSVERGALIGKTIWNAEALQDLHIGWEALERLQTEKLVRYPEVHLMTRGDRDLVVEVVSNVYEEGQRRAAQFNIRDITERKQFDQQFQQTARLESLGILAGGIAHDFNNLLAGILGNAGLALGEAPPGTPYQRALKDVVYASQRAADLTRQMLAYAGKGRINVGPLDFSALVRDISKLVQSSISKSVELKLELPEHLPPVEADAGQMQQVVMNLVINGAEAIGEGKRGLVKVSTQLVELNAEDLRLNFASAELSPGKYVVLEVVDNGSGMDEATRARIFDPFFTTKFTGRGLGLAAVQGIIRGHRGGIRVSSSPGKGTLFQIVLPAIAEAMPAPALKPKFDDLHGTGLVLVIDDEQIVLETTRVILERHGYRVLTAGDGETGVAMVREHAAELGLVILDLTMPIMGGEEALGHIKTIAPEVPVILSSGYDSSQAVGRFGEKALAGFLHKPSTVTNLLETVKLSLRS